MMTKPAQKPTISGALQIRRVALKLFAEHGIDGVAVRQIAEAAGQKNHASLTYHFGSKEALIRELIIEGARHVNERRNAWLDELEARGGPQSVTEVLNGILSTSINLGEGQGEYYNRFIASVQLSNRALFRDALGGRWNSGYQRCLNHIRQLLPGVPLPDLNQRLIFMGLALGGILSGREAELSNQSRDHPMWSDSSTLLNAALALAAMVEHPAT